MCTHADPFSPAGRTRLVFRSEKRADSIDSLHLIEDEAERNRSETGMEKLHTAVRHPGNCLLK
jgi:hypothetical protein